MTPNQIREAREHLGLSQAGMSRLMGVHKSTYLKWEHGENNLSAAAGTLINLFLYLKKKLPASKFNEIKRFFME
jgi:DNA-binding transcriptional regulator YiaG